MALEIDSSLDIEPCHLPDGHRVLLRIGQASGNGVQYPTYFIQIHCEKLFDQVFQILSIAACAEPSCTLAHRLWGNPFRLQCNFFQAGDLKALPFFDRSDERAGVLQRIMAAGRPGELMTGLEGALCKAARELIYQANQSSKIDIVEFTDAFYRQLLRQPNDRFLIHPREFEAVVSDIFQRMGHKTYLTPRSGDKGRDIIAHIETKIAPYLMLVECKRYARHRLVGPDPIARIWARLFEDKANLAMVITTSGFQPVAKREAMIKGYQVSLKDGEDFISWIKSLKLR